MTEPAPDGRDVPGADDAVRGPGGDSAAPDEDPRAAAKDAAGVPAPAWARLVLAAIPFVLAALVLVALKALGG